METIQENSKTIKWDDFLDINENDDFEFKLLDDGLGFHQQDPIEKKNTFVRKKIPKVSTLNSSSRHAASIRLRKPVNRQIRARESSSRSTVSELPEVSLHQESLPSLKTGYSKKQPPVVRRTKDSCLDESKILEENRVERKEKKIKKKIKQATFDLRFSSFILDLLFLIGGGLLFVLVGSFTLGVTLDNFGKTLLEPRYLPYLGTLIGSFYLFYFSLLDCDQSFGKKIMGIKVINKNDRKSARFMQNASRACLTILIIPVIFSLQDSMTDTDVIRCN